MTFLVEQLGQSDQRPLGGSVKCRGGKFGIGQEDYGTVCVSGTGDLRR